MRARLLALLLLAAFPSAAGADTPGLEDAACAGGSTARAAVDLYGSGTEVVRSERIAGLRTVLVSEPYIAPGTRQRMVRAGSRWCDAAAGLNLAWSGAVGDGAKLAAAYARLAAAPYFDGVRVVSQRSSAGTHRLVTVARTNGVRAEWTIVTDAGGVRSAHWRATELGVGRFERQLEGLTALPGAHERYLRTGRLLNAQRGLPVRGAPAPGDPLSYTTSDGFEIIFSVSDSRVGPDPGGDTAEERANTLRMMRDLVGENMEDFLAWGFRSEWSTPVFSVGLVRPGSLPIERERTGYVYVDDSTSLYCFACVFIADDFNIHIISQVDLILQALGYDYPEATLRDKLSDVLGHEIFHNFQNSYVKPASTDRSVPGFYSEGTARMQETLHDYAKISYQPSSLIYVDDANGCNGFHGAEPAGTFEGGPFQKSYSACNFWMPFFGAYGASALVKLVRDGAPQGAETVLKRQEASDADPTAADSQEKILRAVEIATGRPVYEASAHWATAIITGKNLVWGPIAGPGPALDWGMLLERWAPAKLAVGGATTASLGPGGITAVEVTDAVRPQLISVPDAAGARLAVLRDRPSGTQLTFPAPGEYVAGPAAGEKLYLMAASAGVATQDVTLRAVAGGPPPAPPATVAPATGAPAATKGAGVSVRCGAVRRRVLTCSVRGLSGKRVRATLLRGKRKVATAQAPVRSGRATVRLRATRGLRRGRAILRLVAAGPAVERAIRIR